MATVLEASTDSGVSSSSLLRTAEPVVDFALAKQLAARHGTPLLVVSRSAVRRNYRAMKSALPNVTMFYAAKSNPALPILRTLREEGCSVDVCSYGEMQAALSAGFTPDQMIHTHPCKTVANLMDCYNNGLRVFIFDNEYELRKIAQHTPDVSLILRVAVSSSTSRINLSAKFGACEQDSARLIVMAHRMGMHVQGLSFHVGSQCRSPEDFDAALAQARRIYDECAAQGVRLEVIDVGGGFPAPYRDAVLPLDTYCRTLANAIEMAFGDVPVRIIAEPGRGLSADTTTLITKVLGKSMRNGMMWYIIDDGLYGSFSGKVFDHTDFPILAEDAESRPLMPCVLAGPTCDSSDVVTRDQLLPELEIDELLIVPTMGAYTSASASNFNGLDLARYVAIE